MLRFAALDTARNVSAIIPADAQAFTAPPRSEELLQLAYIFPRTKPNPIFQIEELRMVAKAVKAAESRGEDVRRYQEKELAKFGISSERLSALGVDSARFEDLKSDLHKIGMLNLDFDEIKAMELRTVKGPGEEVINMNSVEVTVQ